MSDLLVKRGSVAAIPLILYDQNGSLISFSNWSKISIGIATSTLDDVLSVSGQQDNVGGGDSFLAVDAGASKLTYTPTVAHWLVLDTPGDYVIDISLQYTNGDEYVSNTIIITVLPRMSTIT